jgi:hypothetical protein
MAEELDELNPLDPTHTSRDYKPAEVRSTTYLRMCGDAFKAWSKDPSPANEAALAAARVRFNGLVSK